MCVGLDIGLFNRGKNSRGGAEGSRRIFLRIFLEGALMGMAFYGNGVAYRLSTRYATPLMIHHPLRVLRGFAGDFCCLRIGPGIIQPG